MYHQETNQGENDEPGIAAVTADAAQNCGEPLTADRLHLWHSLLFPGPNRANFTVGRWRDDRLGRMRVVSANSAGQTVVHFVAPAAERLEPEMGRFLDWFNRPESEPDLRKPAIAHLWFVSIHPYDDGNGRIARAITDLALSRCDGTDTRLYSMSGEILRQRSRYYRALQVTQSGSMNITAWMLWFFDCLAEAMIKAEIRTAAGQQSVEQRSEVVDVRRPHLRCGRLGAGWSKTSRSFTGKLMTSAGGANVQGGGTMTVLLTNGDAGRHRPRGGRLSVGVTTSQISPHSPPGGR